MYGQGQAARPPQPASSAAVVVLRVLFTALPVLSIGFLAWGSMLRLACVFRRTVDWLLFAVVAGMDVVALTCFIASDDDNDWQADTGGTLLVLCMFCVMVYFLVSDLVRKRPSARQQWGAGFGYPQPAAGRNPYATGFATTGFGAAGPRPTPVPRPAPAPAPAPAPRPAPALGPAPTPPPAPRIDRVRAELDELSDYLRKERGDGQDSGEGAR